MGQAHTLARVRGKEATKAPTPILDKILIAMREHEGEHRIPFLGWDITRLLSAADTLPCPADGSSRSCLLALQAAGRIERVPVDVLESYAGRGLPLRKYWPTNPVGWRTTR